MACRSVRPQGSLVVQIGEARIELQKAATTGAITESDRADAQDKGKARMRAFAVTGIVLISAAVATYATALWFRLSYPRGAGGVTRLHLFDNPRDASVGSSSIHSSVFAQACCQAVAPPSTQTIIQTGESGRIIQFALKLVF